MKRASVLLSLRAAGQLEEGLGGKSNEDGRAGGHRRMDMC